MSTSNRHMPGALLAGTVMLAGASSLAWGAAPGQIETFRGTARTDDGTIAYFENHRVVHENGRYQENLTHYLDATGREFAELRSSFATHPYVPDYRFEDTRFGRQDGADVRGGVVTVYGRATEDADLKTASLPLSENMVTGQGLHFFLQDNLERLLRPGAEARVEFLMPHRGQEYTFRIRRLAQSGQTAGTASFKIDIDNWFFRMFAPHIEVRYDIRTKRLLSYRGPSNILDGEQNMQNVSITYHYEDPVAGGFLGSR